MEIAKLYKIINKIVINKQIHKRRVQLKNTMVRKPVTLLFFSINNAI